MWIKNREHFDFTLNCQFSYLVTDWNLKPQEATSKRLLNSTVVFSIILSTLMVTFYRICVSNPKLSPLNSRLLYLALPFCSIVYRRTQSGVWMKFFLPNTTLYSFSVIQDSCPLANVQSNWSLQFNFYDVTKNSRTDYSCRVISHLILILFPGLSFEVFH